MQTWFEGKVKHVKVSQSGAEQLVTESFLFDAVSYTDAESRIISEMKKQVKGGEFAIVDIKKSQISEVFPFEDGQSWWKGTIQMITVDEEAGREKRIRVVYLLMADDINEALQRLRESLDYLVIPFQVQSLAVSQIIDVFPYESNN